MTSPTDQGSPTKPRRRLGRLFPVWSASPPTDRPTNGHRPTSGHRPAVTDQQSPTDRPTNGRRPAAADPKSPTKVGRRPWFGRWRKKDDVDDRARRAQLTDQVGAAGLPTGYGLVFGVLVAGSVTAGLVSFLFSFGNVRWLNIWLGLPGWIQPLVSPAVDLSVIVLVVVIQYLTLAGVPKRMLRSANIFLIGAGVAMLGANVAPSIIMGWAADDPATAGRFYGRGAIEAFAPAALVCWAHVGPGLVRAFAFARNRADHAALLVVELRTLATEKDRAQAAADRDAAAHALALAQLEADRMRAAAAQVLADADQAQREIADQAAAAQRQRSIADQAATDQADAIRREAERAARLVADRAAADQAAADRAAAEIVERERTLADRRREIEAAADRAAADRRAAAELLAEAETGRSVRPSPTTTRRPVTPPLRSVPTGTTATTTPAAAGRTGGAARSGGTRDELAAERAERAKGIFTDWATVTPKKRDLQDQLGINSGAAMDVRRLLEAERLAAGEQTA